MYSTPLTHRALGLLSLGVITTLTGVIASPVDKVELMTRQIPTSPWTPSSRLGCYTDNTGGFRALNADSYGSYNGMTVDSCASFCLRYPMFGLEYGRECWCGERLGELSVQVDDSECSFPCSGDSSQRCGAGDRLDIYENGKWKPRSPDTTLPGAPYLGCFIDPGNPRALPDKVVSSNEMTARVCQNTCKGYRYFGTEYGRECWCGNHRPTRPAPASDCSFGCTGDDDEYCGAGHRLSVYGPVGEPGQSSISSVWSSTFSTFTSSPDFSTSTTLPWFPDWSTSETPIWTVPTWTESEIPFSTDIELSTWIDSDFPTTDIETGFPTTVTDLPITETDFPITETDFPFTGISTLTFSEVLPTWSEFPTSDIETALPTTDIDTELPTTGIETDLPTTVIETDLPTIDIDTDLPTTGIETELPTTGIETELPTTAIETEIPTIDIGTELPTSGIETELPTTGIETEIPTIDIGTELPTTGIDTEIPTTEIPVGLTTTLVLPTLPTPNLPSSSHIHSHLSSLTTFILPLPTRLPV